MNTIRCKASAAKKRYGHTYSHQVALEVCLAAECPFRGRCGDYSAVSAENEAAAMAELGRRGHHVAVPRLPLLEVSA